MGRASSVVASSRELHSADAASKSLARNGSHKHHVLTVALEDYYHAAAFRPWIREETWYRFEDRLAQSTRLALDMLDRCEAHATFFVDSRTAQSAPNLVREVAGRGHEIACRGDHRGPPNELGPERFREEAMRCRDQLEEVVGCPVLGFRLGSDSLGPQELWVLDVLAECGYLYDSSIGPALGINTAKVLRSYHRHRAQLSHRLFQEVPVSPLAIFGMEVPVASGSLRHLPTAWVQNAIQHWHRHNSDAYVMYFRTWELDPDQPRINAGAMAARIMHYRSLDRMPALLEKVLASYRFTSVAAHLGLEPARMRSAGDGSEGWEHRVSLAGKKADLIPVVERLKAAAPPMPVTVVVPCFNESQSLRYLSNTLQSVASSFESEYSFTFLFVDDGSTDNTWSLLQELFGSRSDCRLVRHERNQGLARTIETGIRHAETSVVCSMDCDCTYDPHELGRMIPLLANGVDLVTASPYHPQGSVRNVSSWRIFLSKSLSRLYRVILRQKLHTYTSCFRVYRRETAMSISVERGGFFGVTEMLGRLDLEGYRIVECPATLDVRMLGHSKMRILLTIVGHLGLLALFVGVRFGIGRPRRSTVQRTANE